MCLFNSWIVYCFVVKQFRRQDNDTQLYCDYDAGHSGYDGGTIGTDGTCEKDLTLELALETE